MGINIFSGKGQKVLITGLMAAFIRSCIIINILSLAVTYSLNPFHGLSILKKVIRKRRSVQGLPAVRKYVRGGNRYFFSENIPGWPSAAFNGFFRAEILRASAQGGKFPLSTIIFAITSRCRLGCLHCYEWNNLSHIDRLSYENLESIIIKIKGYGINHIQLSGGEPLERFDDLIRLIRFARKETDLWLLTSGFGLISEKALALKSAGLSGADISLDHWDESEHNRSRNSPKSFWWAREAVRNCREAGIATTLSICAFRSFVTRENLEKYADLAKEWGAGFIRVLEPREAGRYRGVDVALLKEQTVILERFYQEMNSSDKFIDYPVVSYPGYQQRREGCLGAGNRYLYIDSAGEIHACPFCQQSAGNIISQKLEDAVPLLKKFGCQAYALNPA